VILLSASIVAVAIIWSGWHIGGEMRAARGGADVRDRVATLLTLFAPGLAAAQQDPRAFLVWQPIAKAARQIFPEEFASLDRAAGGAFPFSTERIEAAHARWTTDWLAWELAHDTEYKLKAAVVEHELSAQGGTGIGRARLDAIEREKLDLYQRHYADYVKTAKALQALIESQSPRS
jgi:hypothetical protein